MRVEQLYELLVERELPMGVASMKTFLRRVQFAVTALLLLVGMGTPLRAQYRASLQGTVTDSQGGVIPGATVTLTSKETNITKTATTSDTGVYTIPGLAPGTYSITVEKQGFAKQNLDNILI